MNKVALRIDSTYSLAKFQDSEMGKSERQAVNQPEKNLDNSSVSAPWAPLNITFGGVSGMLPW